MTSSSKNLPGTELEPTRKESRTAVHAHIINQSVVWAYSISGFTPYRTRGRGDEGTRVLVPAQDLSLEREESRRYCTVLYCTYCTLLLLLDCYGSLA